MRSINRQFYAENLTKGKKQKIQTFSKCHNDKISIKFVEFNFKLQSKLRKMLKRLVCSALFVIICNFASGQNEIAGNWRGAVERLGSIQIVEFSFYYEGDSLRGLYNIPDMGLYEEPVSGISYSKAGLSFKFFMGKFQALYDAQNDEITGENKNWDLVRVLSH